MKLGLCWAGGPRHRNDRNRSTDFADWLPLFRLVPVTIHSLQLGDRADEWRDHLYYLGVGDLRTPLEGIEDWADTARVLRTLDLIITVDTAVLHLAGGMGLPVWAVLAASPDFRWGLGTTTTPWYPTVRLYRQQQAGNWQTVVDRIVSDLIDELTPREVTP